MRLAPDTVQNVERDLLTGGYKIEFPLFHKLFLDGVENFGGAVERSGLFVTAL
jgi:hypothetical protein